MSTPTTRDASPVPTATTQTVTQTRPPQTRQRTTRLAGTLVLRGEPSDNDRRIRWAGGIVDNEGLGRKSSKGICPTSPSSDKNYNNFFWILILTPYVISVCCIYHKSHAVGESSSDESSSSSSSDSNESDSGADDGRARMIGAGSGKAHRKGREKGHGHHDHDHGEGPGGNGDGNGRGGDGSKKGKGVRRGRKTSPNAYERMKKSGS
jgi:protein phosphatase 1 regulatory subunit 11